MELKVSIEQNAWKWVYLKLSLSYFKSYLIFFCYIALVHDLAESIVGDLTPYCGVSKEDKKMMEQKAMEEICKLIEPRGERILELFEVRLQNLALIQKLLHFFIFP